MTRSGVPTDPGNSASDELEEHPSDEPGIPDVGLRPKRPVSVRGLLAVGLLFASLAAVSVYSIRRHTAEHASSDDAQSKRASDRPSAATTEPRRLDMALAAPVASASAASDPFRVPAIVATPDELDPAGVRRASQPSAGAGQTRPMSPVDAPVMLVTGRAGPARAAGPEPSASEDTPPNPARQRVDAYQRQLQGLLDNLMRSSSPSANPSLSATLAGVSAAPPTAMQPGSGLFGGQLTGSATPATAAALLGNRSLTLPKGTTFTCALKTRVVSATSGLIGCQVQRNVYSDDGRVLLIERGSHLDGEYRVTTVRPGTVRIPVLWTRIRTPEGVVVDIDSPGTGPLGESGIDGAVDNRWFERIGAALLLSVIDDSVNLAVQGQHDNGQAGTVVLPSTTGSASKLAEKVLDSTINIPPLIYQNQGGIVGIHVARDVDFSAVYELQAIPR